jgi:hypothetical protein
MSEKGSLVEHPSVLIGIGFRFMLLPLYTKQVFDSGNDIMFPQDLTWIQIHYRMETRKIYWVHTWKQRVLDVVAIIVSETIEEWRDTGVSRMNNVVFCVDSMHHV